MKVVFVAFVMGIVEERRAEESYGHPIGECERLVFLTLTCVFQHSLKELMICSCPVLFCTAEPVVKVMVIATSMKEKFRDWNPARFRPSAVADD